MAALRPSASTHADLLLLADDLRHAIALSAEQDEISEAAEVGFYDLTAIFQRYFPVTNDPAVDIVLDYAKQALSARRQQCGQLLHVIAKAIQHQQLMDRRLQEAYVLIAQLKQQHPPSTTKPPAQNEKSG